MRHPFFKKYNLDIEKEEQELAEQTKEDISKNLNHVIKSSERKLQPKVLTDSQSFSPSLSDFAEETPRDQGATNTPQHIGPFEKQTSKDLNLLSDKNLKRKSNEKKIDDTLELSQSVFLSPSQLQEALSVVFSYQNADKSLGQTPKSSLNDHKKIEVESFIITDVDSVANVVFVY